jgi:hypothetical protein
VLAARIGVTPEQFYDMTPFELSCYTDAFNIKQDEKRQEIIVLAYTTAALTRVEKMPSLQSMLDAKDSPEEKPSASEEEIVAELRRMNAVMGGDIIEPNP